MFINYTPHAVPLAAWKTCGIRTTNGSLNITVSGVTFCCGVPATSASFIRVKHVSFFR